MLTKKSRERLLIAFALSYLFALGALAVFVSAKVDEIPPGQSMADQEGYLRRVHLDAWEREQLEAAK